VLINAVVTLLQDFAGRPDSRVRLDPRVRRVRPVTEVKMGARAKPVALGTPGHRVKRVSEVRRVPMGHRALLETAALW